MVTLSIGVSVSGDSESTAESLLNETDEALYEAKRLGRNRVIPTPPQMAKSAVEAAPD